MSYEVLKILLNDAKSVSYIKVKTTKATARQRVISSLYSTLCLQHYANLNKFMHYEQYLAFNVIRHGSCSIIQILEFNLHILSDREFGISARFLQRRISCGIFFNFQLLKRLCSSCMSNTSTKQRKAILYVQPKFRRI